MWLLPHARAHHLVGVPTPRKLQAAERREAKRVRKLSTGTHHRTWVEWVWRCVFAAWHTLGFGLGLGHPLLAAAGTLGLIWAGWGLAKEGWERVKEYRLMIEEGIVVPPWDRRERREEPF